jgi:hypothetical protein
MDNAVSPLAYSPVVSSLHSSALLSGLNTGAYRNASTPPTSPLAHLQSGHLQSGHPKSGYLKSGYLTTKQVIEEFEHSKFFDDAMYEKLGKKALKKLYKEQANYAKALAVESDLNQHEKSKFNMEFFELKLQIAEVHVVLYDTVHELRSVYEKWIDQLKRVNDPYRTDKERLAEESIAQEINNELNDTLKKLNYITMEKDKLLEEKIQKHLKFTDWVKVKFRRMKL